MHQKQNPKDRKLIARDSGAKLPQFAGSIPDAAEEGYPHWYPWHGGSVGLGEATNPSDVLCQGVEPKRNGGMASPCTPVLPGGSPA